MDDEAQAPRWSMGRGGVAGNAQAPRMEQARRECQQCDSPTNALGILAQRVSRNAILPMIVM